MVVYRVSGIAGIVDAGRRLDNRVNGIYCAENYKRFLEALR